MGLSWRNQYHMYVYLPPPIYSSFPYPPAAIVLVLHSKEVYKYKLNDRSARGGVVVFINKSGTDLEIRTWKYARLWLDGSFNSAAALLLVEYQRQSSVQKSRLDS